MTRMNYMYIRVLCKPLLLFVAKKKIISGNICRAAMRHKEILKSNLAREILKLGDTGQCFICGVGNLRERVFPLPQF